MTRPPSAPEKATPWSQAQLPPAVSPFTLLTAMQVTRPNGMVLVEGYVKQVRPYPKGNVAYLTLTGQDGSVDAQVPLARAPSVGQQVRVYGAVSVQPSRLGNGLNVKVTGEWLDAPAAPAAPRVELQKPRRVSLERWLEDFTPARLAVVGTQKAFSDLSAALPAQFKLDYSAVPMTDRAAIIEAVEALVASGMRGVILTRGGSNDATDEVWNAPEFVAELLRLEVPFYTAIGHSDGLLLVDLYADQAFTTPTHVGQELARIIERRAVSHHQQRELQTLREENQRLRQTRPGPQERSGKGLPPLAWAALLGTLGGLLVMLALLLRGN